MGLITIKLKQDKRADENSRGFAAVQLSNLNSPSAAGAHQSDLPSFAEALARKREVRGLGIDGPVLVILLRHDC